MFGWHKEDMDLYSINFLHVGHPKFWYSVDLRDNSKFEAYVRSKFPDEQKECKEFIRHKNTLIHPRNLIQQGIRMRKATHYPGEFMISRASAYHSGFNSGYNLAEAVNFALPSWIEIGKNAGICECQDDSVKIDMMQFEENLKTVIQNDYCIPEWVKIGGGRKDMKCMARRMMTRALPSKNKRSSQSHED
jgi:hypothetical protein